MKTDQAVLYKLERLYQRLDSRRLRSLDYARKVDEIFYEQSQEDICNVRDELTRLEGLTIAQENTISGLIAHNTHMTRELEIIALEDIKFGDEPHSFADKALKEAGIWK